MVTVKYQLTFYASIDLLENPCAALAILKAVSQRGTFLEGNILKGNMLHVELPLKFKDENEMRKAKKIFFDDLNAEWKIVRVFLFDSEKLEFLFSFF